VFGFGGRIDLDPFGQDGLVLVTVALCRRYEAYLAVQVFGNNLKWGLLGKKS